MVQQQWYLTNSWYTETSIVTDAQFLNMAEFIIWILGVFRVLNPKKLKSPTKSSESKWDVSQILVTPKYDKNSKCLREKGRDLTKSYDKSPDTHRQIQNATWQHKTPISITQLLLTDFERSVGVTIATQLVWLNQFTGSQPSN